MPGWKRAISAFDWGTRIDFIVSLFFDWRALLVVAVVAGAGGLVAYMEDIGPAGVFFAVIGVGAAAALFYIAASFAWNGWDARGALVRELDDLLAAGVGYRNRLIPPIANFTWKKYHRVLARWDRKVLALLQARSVTDSERSGFRTLNLFKGVFHPAQGKSGEQCKLEAIWTRKLELLRAIIHRLGS